MLLNNVCRIICSVFVSLSQYLTIAVNLFIYNGKRPSSPYIAVVDVVCFTPRTDIQNFICTLSMSVDFVKPHTGQPYVSTEPTKVSTTCNAILGLTCI